MSNQGQQAAGAQSQAPAKKSRMDVFKTMMNADSVQEQFKNALAGNRDQFVASLIDLYSNDSKLQECDPKAVVMEALKAAVMKLPLNKSLGFAWILTFNNSVKLANGQWGKVMTPTMTIGYKGYIQLAMRTGQYEVINADVVYEGELKATDKLTGKIDLNGEKTSDKIVGYFAHFELLNGLKKTLYMTVEKAAKHAKKYSPSLVSDNKVTVESLIASANLEYSSKNIGWKDGGFNDMALKTAISHLLSKWGYLSIEMINAIESENNMISSEDQRNNAISANGNSKTINIEDVKFENVGGEAVDTSTGEVAPPMQPERGF